MKILRTGQLIKRTEDRTEKDEFTMRLVGTDELREVVTLEKMVYEKLPNKQVLCTDTYEEMYEDMKTGAKILGVFNGKGELIAYRYVGFPGCTDRNLGNDIHMAKGDLNKVVHLETTVVHPDYRGNELQSLTLQQIIPVVKDLGYRHLLCTVSPQNIFSLFNIMKNGLKIKALKKKYGKAPDGSDGLLRFILHKDLEPNGILKANKLFKIDVNNLEEQEKFINNGFIGYWLFKESKELNYVLFE